MQNDPVGRVNIFLFVNIVNNQLIFAGYFFMLLLSADFLQNYYFFFKKLFKEHFQSVKLFGSRLGPELGPNCLHRLSATARKELKALCTCLQRDH